MHLPSSIKITALGLAMGSAAFAQSPVPAPPTPPAVPPEAASVPSPASQLFPVVSQSSRLLAFDAEPGRGVRSLYLKNGSVVELAPGIGGQLGSVLRKGEKITVTGMKSEINGQAFVEAASVRLNEHTFSGSASAPGPLSNGVAPAPLRAAKSPPASAPQPKNRAVAVAPCGATAAAPPPSIAPDGPPPPPPPPGFEAGPPPPPPSGIAPPPPPDGMAPPSLPQN